MAGGIVLRKGQTWEKYYSTVVQDGSLRGTYVLEEIFEHFFGHFAYLRNVETGRGRQSHAAVVVRRRVGQTPRLLEVGG